MLNSLELESPWQQFYSYNLKPAENFQPVLLGSENVFTNCPTLFVFGGFANGNHQNKTWILKLPSRISTLNLKKLVWEEVKLSDDIPSSREFPCLSYDKRSQLVYLFGGCGTTYLNDIWTFDLKKTKWTKITTDGEIPSPRCGCSGIFSKDKFYVFGGYHGMYLNDFYELDLEIKVWKKIDSPHTIPSLTVLTLNTAVSANYLTIFAGYNGKEYVTSMYHFDFNTREWKSSVSKLIGSGGYSHSRCMALRGSYKYTAKRNNFMILYYTSTGTNIYEYDEEESELIKYTLPKQSIEELYNLDGRFICELDDNTLVIAGKTGLCLMEIRKIKSTKDLDYFLYNLERNKAFVDVEFSIHNIS